MAKHVHVNLDAFSESEHPRSHGQFAKAAGPSGEGHRKVYVPENHTVSLKPRTANRTVELTLPNGRKVSVKVPEGYVLNLRRK